MAVTGVLCHPSLMASIFAVFFLLSLTFARGGVESQQNQCRQPISLGSSLNTDVSWPSFYDQFEFGFYQQGSGFMVGIWLVGIGHTTVVWTANRDDPPVTSNATLELTKGGKLVLRTDDEQGGRVEKLIAPTLSSDSAYFACMLDSGNFVLYNKTNFTIWETFKHPTDTILGGQILSTNGELTSSLSETNHSTGRFRLKMQSDGNLVLNKNKTADIRSEPYWSSNTTTDNHGLNYRLYLNNTGILQIINTTSMDSVEDLYSSSTSNNTNHTIYRATLDVDGFFRLYSELQAFDRTGGLKSSSSSFEWSAPGDKDICNLKGSCGFNSFCTSQDSDSTRYGSKSYCLCLPGTEFVNVNDKTLGCKRNFSEVGCKGGKDHVASYNITTIENMIWPEDNPYIDVPMSTKEECSNSCLEDCNCEAALFINSHCQRQKLPLRYVKGDRYMQTIAFFKVGTRSIKSWNENREKPPVHVTSKRVIMQILVLILALSAFSCLALGIAGLYMFKIRVLRYKRLKESETLVGLALNLFSYDELKRATNGFKDMLGQDSSGRVYKGALYKGKKLVAVKRLNCLVEDDESRFRAKMQAIGRTRHKNLVRLLGYCVEDSERILVYEFMSNGPLDFFLFRGIRRPDWGERARIALDVARGILYLHEECKAPIIHCDIVPENILMDEFWTAKISGFHWAELLMPDQTIRGTKGYVAPECYKKTPISVKIDVYNYGVMLLEIVCCQSNEDYKHSRPEEIILSTWVYNCFVAGELDKIMDGEEVDKTSLENMVKVGLWCIQEEPHLRPSMKSVVLMLEGIIDISVPPCPTNAS